MVISGSFPGLREMVDCSLAGGGSEPIPVEGEEGPWIGVTNTEPTLESEGRSFSSNEVSGTYAGIGKSAGARPAVVSYGGRASRDTTEEMDGVTEKRHDSMELDASIEKPHMLYYLACKTEAFSAGTTATLKIRGAGFGEERELGEGALQFAKEGLSDADVQNCIRLALDEDGNPIPPRVLHDDPFNATVVQSLVAEIELAPSAGFDGEAGTDDDPPDEMLGLWDVTIAVGEISNYTMEEAFDVEKIEMVGAYKFGSFLKGKVIPLPEEYRHEDRLNATHLLIPADCQIDDQLNQTFGLIRYATTIEDRTLVDETGQLCVKIEPGMYEGTFWDAYRAIVNLFRWLFGLPPITAQSMFNDLVTSYNIPQDERDEGWWWQTPAYSAVGRHEFFIADAQGNPVDNQADIVVVIRQPIRIETKVPDTGNVKRFERYEAEITLDDEYFHHLGTDSKGMTQQDRFDTYDADRDGQRIRVDARFRLMDGDEVVQVDGENQDYTVPCFPMKESDTGPFKWKIRFSPPHETAGSQMWVLTVRATVWHEAKGDTAGDYDEFNQLTVPEGGGSKAYYHYYGGFQPGELPAEAEGTNGHRAASKFYMETDTLTGAPYDSDLPVPTIRFACGAAVRPGPLRVPSGGENPRYLYRETAGGAAQPVFLLGMARPWAVVGNPAPWGAHETIDRSVDIYPKMTSAGIDLNYVWFAPWETQLVHNKTNTEIWYPTETSEVEHAVPAAEWTSYGYYDQGRAKRMDEWVQGHENSGTYMALTVWAHQSLQEGPHPWPESGWNLKDNDEEENGFSRLNSDVLDFLNAASSPTGSKWLHQKNFYRYMVARYGYSTALAIWVSLDETEGIGDAEDFCEINADALNTWHDQLVLTVREFDWRSRPVTASSTHWNRTRDPFAETEKMPNVHGAWSGGTEKFDVLSHHSYHAIYYGDGYASMHSNSDAWRWRTLGDRWGPVFYPLCGRMYQWVENTSGVGVPRWLVTECALTEREWDNPSDPVSKGMFRSYIHFASWSAFAAGHMGNPLKWCDGKEFGEMFQRGTGPFSAANYPEVSDDLQALRQLVANLDLNGLRTLVKCETDDGTGGDSPVLAWGLKSTSTAVIWVFDNDFEKNPGATWGVSARSPASPQDTSKASHRVKFSMPPGTYTVSFLNTWDAGPAYLTTTLSTDAGGVLNIPVTRLATTARSPGEVWDGADCMLRIAP